MRTAVISDIHIDINSDYDVFGALVRYLQKNNIELLIIAGDISSNPELTIQTVAKLEQISGSIVKYVPGNHDMWNHTPDRRTNDEIYRYFCEDSHCLSGKIYRAGDHVLLGDVAWFDYSYANPRYSKEEFDRMTFHGRTWQDSLYNTWSKDNVGCCRHFFDMLEKQLKEYQKEKIVFVTHMISHEAFKVPEQTGDWSYFNAFLGSKKLEELCRQYRPQYAVCGHVHYRHNHEENGVTWLCRCLNYATEWQGEKNVETQIADAIQILNL